MKPVEGYCSVEWAIGCGGCCGKKSFLREEGSRGREAEGGRKEVHVHVSTKHTL